MLTLLVCHTNTDPMRISLVFKKIILAIFGRGYQRWKFLFFSLFGQGYQWWKLFLLGHFWPRLPKVKVCFLGHFWPRITTVKVSYFQHFWPKILMVKVLFFLCHFWPGMQTVKVFVFLAFSAKDTNGESLFFLCHFWPRIPMVKVLVGLGHFWPRIPMVKFLLGLGHFWPRLLLLATSAMNTNDESYVCDLRFWATSGITLCQTRIRWRQSLAPHCATRTLSSGRQLLAWDCKYEHTRTPVGKHWHASTSISYPGMERVYKKHLSHAASKKRTNWHNVLFLGTQQWKSAFWSTMGKSAFLINDFG